jgi:transcriptional regulator with XRE-family HTH domain
MSETLPFGTRLQRARQLRGLSVTALAERTGLAAEYITALELQYAAEVPLRHLHTLAGALQVPASYFVAESYHTYTCSRFHSLPDTQRQELLARPLHLRMAWAVQELEALWGPEHFSLSRVAQQVPLMSEPDLRLVLTGDLQLSGEQWAALVQALVMPPELTGLPRFASTAPELVRYLRVLELARSLDVTPETLAHLVSQAAVNRVGR